VLCLSCFKYEHVIHACSFVPCYFLLGFGYHYIYILRLVVRVLQYFTCVDDGVASCRLLDFGWGHELSLNDLLFFFRGIISECCPVSALNIPLTCQVKHRGSPICKSTCH
jgi:hypothetical protein